MELGVLIPTLLIVLFGLPHGSLDPFTAIRGGWPSSLGGMLTFHALYLLIALGFILMWWQLPLIGLALFLLFSAWHFGADLTSKSWIARISYGAYVLCLPMAFKADAVSQIFQILTGIAINWPIALPAIVATASTVIMRNHLSLLRLLELVALGITAVVCSPLVYFVIFFCLFHSPRHLLHEARLIPAHWRTRASLCVIALTAIPVLIAWGLSHQISELSLTNDAGILRLLFVGLAGLTVPHMLLIDWTNTRHV